MEQLRGYQKLAFLFKRLKFWLNNHVLQLLFLLAGFNNNQKVGGGDYSNVPGNSWVFHDLLADLDVLWRETTRCSTFLFDLFYRMAADGRSNRRYLRDLNLIVRLPAGIRPAAGQQDERDNVERRCWLLHNNPRPSLFFSVFLPVSSSGSGTGGNNNARLMPIIDLSGLGHLRPALPILSSENTCRSSPSKSFPTTGETICWPSLPASATKSTSTCWPQPLVCRTRPASRWPVRNEQPTWNSLPAYSLL